MTEEQARKEVESLMNNIGTGLTQNTVNQVISEAKVLLNKELETRVGTISDAKVIAEIRIHAAGLITLYWQRRMGWSWSSNRDKIFGIVSYCI